MIFGGGVIRGVVVGVTVVCCIFGDSVFVGSVFIRRVVRGVAVGGGIGIFAAVRGLGRGHARGSRG